MVEGKVPSVQVLDAKMESLKVLDPPEVLDVKYFRSKLTCETGRLLELCSQWENTRGQDLPHHWTGEVRSIVGKARLLISERFDQFSGLVDDCELCRGEKKTTCQDLAGFWDMVFLQVEEIKEGFSQLDVARSAGWPEPEDKTTQIDPSHPKLAKVKILLPKRKVVAGKSNIAAMIAARRAELAGKSPTGGNKDLLKDVKTFEGGFFNIKSPMAKPKLSPRNSNRAALLGRKLNNLPDLSPLAKVSAQVKHSHGSTNRTRLFLETEDLDAEDKEN